MSTVTLPGGATKSGAGAKRSWLPGAIFVLALAAFVAGVLLVVGNVPRLSDTQVVSAQRAVSSAKALAAADDAIAASARRTLAELPAAKRTNALITASQSDDARAVLADDALAKAQAAVPDRTTLAGSPYFAWFGVLAVALLWLVSAVLAGDVNPLALAMGADNRLSTSKMQVLLWTACVGFVYAMIYGDRVLMYGHVAPITEIPQNVLFALGISVTTAVAAKAITTSQVAGDQSSKDPGPDEPSYDPAALVRDDGDDTASLTKVQILFWTVVAIVVYVTNAFHGLGGIAACTDGCSFPDIDTTLMIFMGLGHATYIGGKLVGNGSTADPNGGSDVSGAAPAAQNGGAPAAAMAAAIDAPAAPPIATPAAVADVVSVSSIAAARPTARLLGIDVSYAQGDAIDWDAVKRTGTVHFAYSRASYGADPQYDDPNFVRNHDACKRLGIPFGAYHFFLFSQPGDEQARHFLARIDGYRGTLCPAVDVEEQSGRGGSTSEMIHSLSAFVTAVERQIGARMLVYTNRNTWLRTLGGTDAFSGHKLWVANVTDGPDVPPAMPPGFPDWTLHQYSWTGRLPLLGGGSTSVDLDVLNGDIALITLPASAAPSDEAPPPVPASGTAAAASPPPPDASLVSDAVSLPPSSTTLAKLVYDGVDKKLKGFGADGSSLFEYEARNDSVADNAWRPDAGCPPGSYLLSAPEHNDPSQPSADGNDWIGEGRWFIPLTGIPDHEGIGIHGGGTCMTPPDSAALLPRQGWCPTLNCIRLQNEDLEALAALPVSGKPIDVMQP